MNLSTLQISWVDLLAVVVLIFGFVRGKRRGMSEELLDVIKWLLIVVAAGYGYEPAGNFLAQHTVFSLLSCYVFSYTIIALAVHFFFVLLRRSVGEKLLESSVFGDGEYYCGMAAGAVRYLCIMMVALAFLNARYYTRAEIQAKLTYQEENFGSNFFPTFSGIQQEVFYRSWTGRLSQDYLGSLLIRPTTPEDKPLGGPVRARERSFNEMLDKR